MTARRRASSSTAVFVAVCMVAATAGRATGADEDAGSTGTSADATITFRGRTLTIGAGFAWGAATVEFHGVTYPARVDGFVLGAIGTVAFQATGQASGVTKIEDLNGDYTALAVGGGFGRGAGKLVMRNDKGVRIVLDLKGTGLQFGAGLRGITLAVGQPGGP